MIGSYASAGAWGARNGPALIRRMLDRERAGTYALLLLAELGVLAVFAGVCVALLVVTRDEPLWLRALGVGTFAMATCGAAVWVVEAISRWSWSVRRPGRLVLASAPSGAASTAVLRSRGSFATPLANAVLVTGWCAFMVVLTAAAPVAAVVFGLLTLASCARLAPFVLGRASAGGVYLTPTAVELRWGVRSASVPWETVLGAPDDLAHGLAGATAASGARTFPVDVPHDVTDQPVAGRVAVPVAYLWLRADELSELIGWYAAQPALRARLGTQESLAWRPTAPSAGTMTDGDPFS
ncbi:hypothetical protein [Terracoccus sp. 273MFTsu3.1]|uniref:hypothetical protein n=1 Tax=Terracoccus sp. 273MFTsu3.1 TaxID=1172188 RepID=UPI00036BF135|nr:hypothetical protein [Terracoccus sp. 273MFTsu3.1]